MKDLLTYIAQNLVEHPQAVDVQETETDGNVVLELRVDPSDMGKVICRQGRIAKEIRTPFFHGKGGRCLETPIFGSR